jgi:hypothetical protein
MSTGEGYSERLGGEYYDPQRAAKVLSISPEEVYAMLESGELAGVFEDDVWHVSKEAVHERLPGEPEQDRDRAVQDPRVDDLPPGPTST